MQKMTEDQVLALSQIAARLSDQVSELDVLYEMTDSGSMSRKSICDIRNAVNDQIHFIENLYFKPI